MLLFQFSRHNAPTIKKHTQKSASPIACARRGVRKGTNSLCSFVIRFNHHYVYLSLFPGFFYYCSVCFICVRCVCVQCAFQMNTLNARLSSSNQNNKSVLQHFFCSLFCPSFQLIFCLLACFQFLHAFFACLALHCFVSFWTMSFLFCFL